MFNDKIGDKFQSNIRGANLIPCMVQSNKKNDRENRTLVF